MRLLPAANPKAVGSPASGSDVQAHALDSTTSEQLRPYAGRVSCALAVYSGWYLDAKVILCAPRNPTSPFTTRF